MSGGLSMRSTPVHPDFSAALGLPTQGEMALRTDVTASLRDWLNGQEQRILSSVTLVPESEPIGISLPIALSGAAGTVSLLGYSTELVGDELVLLTTWQMDDRSSNRPNQHAMFVHLLAADGSIAAQRDGLGVEFGTLLPGDHFIQRHVVPLNGLDAGDYWLQIGLYDASSGVRMRDDAGADRILLQRVDERTVTP